MTTKDAQKTLIKDKTAPQRVAKYTQKMKDLGYVRVGLWVRKEHRERLRKYAEKLRRIVN